MASKEKSSLFLGSLEERTLITAQKDLSIAQASGNLLYAASAHMFLGNRSSIFARIGHNYSLNWIDHFEHVGIEC